MRVPGGDQPGAAGGRRQLCSTCGQDGGGVRPTEGAGWQPQGGTLPAVWRQQGLGEATARVWPGQKAGLSRGQSAAVSSMKLPGSHCLPGVSALALGHTLSLMPGVGF